MLIPPEKSSRKHAVLLLKRFLPGSFAIQLYWESHAQIPQWLYNMNTLWSPPQPCSWRRDGDCCCRHAVFLWFSEHLWVWRLFPTSSQVPPYQKGSMSHVMAWNLWVEMYVHISNHKELLPMTTEGLRLDTFPPGTTYSASGARKMHHPPQQLCSWERSHLGSVQLMVICLP